MKNLSFLLLAIILFSCSSRPEPQAAEPAIQSSGEGMDVWAEEIRSSSDIEKPMEYTQLDWDAITEKIDTSKILNTIINAVFEGKATAYHPIFDTMAMPISDVKKILAASDTFMVADPSSGKTEIKVLSTRSLIDNIQVKEKWNFDSKKFSLKKEVLAIGPVRKVYGPDGDFRGNQILFWVKLNN